MNVRAEVPRPGGDSERGLLRGKSQRPTDVLNVLFAELAVLSTVDSRPNDSSTVSVRRYQRTRRRHATSNDITRFNKRETIRTDNEWVKKCMEEMYGV